MTDTTVYVGPFQPTKTALREQMAAVTRLFLTTHKVTQCKPAIARGAEFHSNQRPRLVGAALLTEV